MFDSIFSDKELIDYINGNLSDPWIGTPFEGYVFLSPKQKGEFGERFVSKFMELSGHKVVRAKTSTAGHDRVINDILVEIKFSLATRNKKGGVDKDKFLLNHMSECKDWERLIFFGINEKEEDCRLVWFTKEDFVKHINSSGRVIRRQQAGEGGKNDDFICGNITSLLKYDFVKDISEW
jgi:hypothetical protein